MGREQKSGPMKRLFLVVVIGALCLGLAYLLLDGLQRPAEIKKKAQEALEDTKDYMAEKRRELERQVAAEADEVEKRLNEIDAMSARATASVGKQRDEAIQALRDEIDHVERRIKDLQAESRNMSAQAREEMERRIRELEAQKQAILERLAALK